MFKNPKLTALYDFANRGYPVFLRLALNVGAELKKGAGQCTLISLAISTSAIANSYNWAGAYAGVNLGSIWGYSQLKANDLNFLNDSYGYYRQTMRSTSVDPGIQIGYLKQLKQRELVGIEADFTYPNSQAQFSLDNPIDIAFDKFTVKNTVQGSLRLRAGYAIDRFLPFATTGLSLGSMSTNYSNETGNNYSKNTTQVGFVVGCGLEYGLRDKLSGRIEYLYSDYGKASNMGLPSIDDVSTAGNIGTNLYTNVLRAVLNYRF